MFTRIKKAANAVRTVLRNTRARVQNILARIMTLVGVRKSRPAAYKVLLLTAGQEKAEKARDNLKTALDRKNEANQGRSQSFDAHHGKPKTFKSRTLRRNSRRNSNQKGRT